MGEELVTRTDEDYREGVVAYAAKRNLILDSAALAILEKNAAYQQILDRAVEENHFMLDEAMVHTLLTKRKTKMATIENVRIEPRKKMPPAREVEGDFHIMEEYDVGKNSVSEGGVGDFLDFFQDKFRFLSSLFGKRTGLSIKPLSALSRSGKNEELHLVGMVKDKWRTKNGHLGIQLEDLEGECVALVLKDNRKLMEEAQTILLDNVIAVKSRKMNEEMVIVSDIYWPDLPQRAERAGKRDLGVAIISDIHVGSKLFMEQEFERFIQWLRGERGNEKERGTAGKVKYLIVAGDNVDGIGVYPDQYDELSIRDIYGQYKAYSAFMEQVPDYIEVFVCPGQHDAVRRADPQPAIPKEFLPTLYERENFHFLGSPNWVEIEGQKVLTYHGASLHELYGYINTLSHSQPQKAIMEILKRRDLMSTYGGKQPYVPNRKDLMTIREEPDVYIGGDMHHLGYGKYRGCLIVNSGTFQQQTDFMKGVGAVPTPAIVPVVNMQTRSIQELDFKGAGND